MSYKLNEKEWGVKRMLVMVIAGWLLTLQVQAGCCGWGGDGPWDDNDWPEWTPMYWMEEFFDDDDYDYYPPPPSYYAPPSYGYMPPGVVPYYGYAPPPRYGSVPYAPPPPAVYGPPGYPPPFPPVQ